jgi:hypothetical protein
MRADADAFDATRATFPAGTLSGAPKIRAMEIIDDLERTPRAPYGGGLGHVTWTGDAELCIVIRTATVEHAGGPYATAENDAVGTPPEGADRITVQAGADMPYYYWLLAQGRQDEIEDSYDVGVAGHLLRGELLYLYSIVAEEYPDQTPPSLPGSAVEIGTSIVQHPRFDYLSLDDPRPFLQDFRNVFGQLLEQWDTPEIRRQ